MPLYIQLKEWIIERIEKEEWTYGYKIPTEVELQKKFDVSRITVRQAINELVSEGALEKLQGKGTFVSEPKLEPLRPDITGFTQDMEAKGHKVTSIVLEQGFVEPNEQLQRILKLELTDPLFKLIRLRLVDDTVIGYHEAYLNHKLLPHVNYENYDFAKDSLYLTLQEEGIAWGGAEEKVEAKPAGSAYGDLLKIDQNAPILKLSRVTELQDGSPYEYTIMAYRADKYKYSIKLR